MIPLQPTPKGEVLRALEEERPFLGKEEGEAREVDAPVIDFGFGEVGVDGDHGGEFGREVPTEVAAHVATGGVTVLAGPLVGAAHGEGMMETPLPWRLRPQRSRPEGKRRLRAGISISTDQPSGVRAVRTFQRPSQSLDTDSGPRISVQKRARGAG